MKRDHTFVAEITKQLSKAFDRDISTRRSLKYRGNFKDICEVIRVQNSFHIFIFSPVVLVVLLLTAALMAICLYVIAPKYTTELSIDTLPPALIFHCLL